MQGYDLEGLAQYDPFLTSSNSAVVSQLAQMNVTKNSIQAQFNTLSSETMNPKRTKKNYFCWSCGSNYNNGIKTWSAKKAVHKEDAYYKKRLGGSKKGCK